MLRLSPKTSQRLAMVFVWGAGVIALLVLVVIIGYVLVQGIPRLSLDFLLTPPAGGVAGGGGISTVIVSTVYLIAFAIIILVPIGLGGGIYLAEYAPDNRLTRLIRSGVELLAGVPSIVFGVFGFAVFVLALQFRFSILSGALTLLCLLLPTMIRTSEEAIRSVPGTYREAALALGATRWQMISKMVLPTALPGIVTAIILCIGRALADTASLYVTMGGCAGMPRDLLSCARALSLHIYYLAMETRDFAGAMATATVLVIMILTINAITTLLSKRFQRKMKGAAS